MWAVEEEERTRVAPERGPVVNLTAFGPRVVLAHEAEAACRLRVENRFGHRVAYRWKANNSHFALTPMEGLLQPKSSATIVVAGQPNTVVFDLLFAYVPPTERPKDAHHFWQALEDNAALHLCYRKRISIRCLGVARPHTSKKLPIPPSQVVDCTINAAAAAAAAAAPRRPWFDPKTTAASSTNTKLFAVKQSNRKQPFPKQPLPKSLVNK